MTEWTISLIDHSIRRGLSSRFRSFFLCSITL